MNYYDMGTDELIDTIKLLQRENAAFKKALKISEDLHTDLTEGDLYSGRTINLGALQIGFAYTFNECSFPLSFCFYPQYQFFGISIFWFDINFEW